MADKVPNREMPASIRFQAQFVLDECRNDDGSVNESALASTLERFLWVTVQARAVNRHVTAGEIETASTPAAEVIAEANRLNNLRVNTALAAERETVQSELHSLRTFAKAFGETFAASQP